MTETLAHLTLILLITTIFVMRSSEGVCAHRFHSRIRAKSTQRELFNSMNTNMTGFRWFSKIFASLCFWKKVAPALEGLAHWFFHAKCPFRNYRLVLWFLWYWFLKKWFYKIFGVELFVEFLLTFSHQTFFKIFFCLWGFSQIVRPLLVAVSDYGFEQFENTLS